MNDVRDAEWQEWIIYLAEINDVNLANVAKITIGFGEEGIQAASDGVVYFDNIRLYPEYPPPKKYNKVVYDDEPNYLREPRWHVWNIELAEFNDVNLANIKRITIGFGDGNQAENDSIMYFENILLGCGKTEFINYDGSVYLDEDPFVNGYDSYPLLLKQDCPLIDAGGDYIDDQPHVLGKTTAWEGFPDSIVADIGFHYFNWYYVNAGERSPADLDDSNTVDFRDFAILANGWETTYDINDLKIMADEWLKSVPVNIIPSFDKDPNNLNGYVTMSIDASDPRIYRVFALIDGKLHREFFVEMEEDPYVGIHTERFANGPHDIKIVGVDIYGSVICSQANQVIFNNEISSVTMRDVYKLDKPYCLYAFGWPGASYIVDINDDFNDTIVYSENFTGDIQAVIPAEAFATENLIYDLTIKNSSEPDESKIYMIFKEARFNPNSPARMIVSIGSEDAQTYCREVIKAVVGAGANKIGIDYVIPLYYSKSTWDNVKRHLQLPYVKIWVHFSHGGEDNISFNGGKVYAFEPWWPPWRDYDALTDLGFKEEPKLNFVYFHTCEGGKTTQFAEALGILPIETYPGERAFIGWTGKVPFRHSVTILLQSYNPYTKALWQELGGSGGDPNNYNLFSAKKKAGQKVKNEGLEDVSWKLRDYGVSDVGHGDQFIWFRYPNIN